MAFEPLKFVVPGVLVEGLTLLAGTPKVGKSWLLLHAAMGRRTRRLHLGLKSNVPKTTRSTARSKTTCAGSNPA